MLYRLLKFPARLAILIYCRHIRTRNRQALEHDGPLLIAANHPNSFLDAIIIATLFKKPVYSLARGDVYTNNFYIRLLTALHILPVYRLSEGAENLGHNYSTFEKCREIFKKNGIVLIFSEGRCINEWKLRPLKKGTARLAISSWEEGIPLEVLPTGINYQSFTSFGKNIELNFGNIITKKAIEETNGYGNTINTFNQLLKESLHELVVEFPDKNQLAVQKHFNIKIPAIKKILLALPAAAGFLLHAPLYLPVKSFSQKRASHNDHYDSVMTGLLFLLYPIYLFIIFLQLTCLVHFGYASLAFILFPLCAWAFVQLKRQF